MKKIGMVLSAICFLLLGPDLLSAQTTTYILLRHAEKDTSAAGSTMMKADPPLTKEGEARARNLPDLLKAYTPDMIYSTNYIRTKSTVTPLAKKFNKEIQLYDPKNLASFAEMLLQQKGKTIVVAGHSNSTPQLVNLLLKENKYPNLDESIYNQFWIVTVTDGRAEAKVITY
ncbi:MAG: phosphoglycerate mutase family protein [Bacteroidota bacterium]